MIERFLSPDVFDYMPTWSPENIKRHYKKRLEEDTDCKKVYPPNRSGGAISKSEYINISKKSTQKSWVEVLFYHEESGEYRKSFADDELVLSITTENERRFITCYHFHEGGFSPFRSECEKTMDRTKDDRKELFERWVENKRKSEEWIDVTLERRE
jgi:hypothetical protein